MKIYIRRSGGIANIPLEGEVDTKDLPAALRGKAEAMMRMEKLRAISLSKNRKIPDSYQYEIRVGEGDDFEAFTLDEGAMEDELTEVLSGMLAELRRRRKPKKPDRERRNP